jgi:hypothetical protein
MPEISHNMGPYGRSYTHAATVLPGPMRIASGVAGLALEGRHNSSCGLLQAHLGVRSVKNLVDQFDQSKWLTIDYRPGERLVHEKRAASRRPSSSSAASHPWRQIVACSL